MRRIKQQFLKQQRFLALFCVALAMVVGTTSQSSAVTKTWDGGDAFWDDNNWNGGGAAPNLNGTDDAVINSGEVTFETFGAVDFEIGTGSSLTVNSGGTWTNVDPEWSNINGDLTLSGGLFSRTGGGVLFFGGANAAANQTTNIAISNGGTLQQRGEVWVGNWENTIDNVTIAVTIDDGTLDLAPAIDPGTGEPNANPSIFIIDPTGDPAWSQTTSPDFTINFTGASGTMKVGAEGMVMPTYTAGVGYGWDTLSYQQLWDLGILQANGLSGLTSDTMTDYFTVTGTTDAADYTLTVGATPGVIGDYNGNGTVDAADYTVWRDGNSPDSTIVGYNLWVTNFGNVSSVATSVPEPSAAVLLLLCTAGFVVRRSAR